MEKKENLEIKLKKSEISLRYGENPHQSAAFFIAKTKDPLALQKFRKLQGKEISFNNLLDCDAALFCLSQLGKKPACVIIKHTNPCGMAYGHNQWEAFLKAWQWGDSTAAFGGIVAVNWEVNEILAEMMIGQNRFFEILLCPEVSTEALKVFAKKKDLRVLVNPALKNPFPSLALDFKRIRGGFLVQEPDTRVLIKKDLKVQTKRAPTEEEIEDLLFAWKVCKSSKSNTIVLVKNQALVGSGVGQQSRVKCCQIAVQNAGIKAQGAVAASDAFFPFPDGPEVLIRAGVKAILQPGGSIRDKETIELCNKHQVAMVFGGVRCFRH